MALSLFKGFRFSRAGQSGQSLKDRFGASRSRSQVPIPPQKRPVEAELRFFFWELKGGLGSENDGGERIFHDFDPENFGRISSLTSN